MLKCEIVGSKFIDGAIAMLRRLKIGDELKIVRELENPDDFFAVALYYAGVKVGYVPRAFNWNVGAILDRGDQLKAHIHVPVVTDTEILPQIIIERADDV